MDIIFRCVESGKISCAARSHTYIIAKITTFGKEKAQSGIGGWEIGNRKNRAHIKNVMRLPQRANKPGCHCGREGRWLRCLELEVLGISLVGMGVGDDFGLGLIDLREVRAAHRLVVGDRLDHHRFR